MRFFLVLLAAWTVGLGVRAGSAAQFEVVSHRVEMGPHGLDPVLEGKPNAAKCHVRLTGPIEKGDLERLSAALQAVQTSGHKGLCLNSRGGSFGEALRIARAMLGKPSPGDSAPTGRSSAWTVVEAGAECYSACAVIFMAGNSFIEDEELGPRISRHLHSRGKLGFHSPYVFNIEAGSFQDKSITLNYHQIEETFRSGAQAVRELARLGLNVGNGGTTSNLNIMPVRLIVNMLAHGPDELFLIDDVGKAISYRIDVFGVAPVRRFGWCQLSNLCDNEFYRDVEIPTASSAPARQDDCSPIMWNGRRHICVQGSYVGRVSCCLCRQDALRGF